MLEDGGPPLIYLTQGWEFYQYKLLLPEDFAENPPPPTSYIYIGQYMGFDMDEPGANPYGSATYRMNIFTGAEVSKSYTLELPEIFSAYSLWINGELISQNGNPNPAAYRPELSHSSITFTAKDRIDIIIAVTNFGHYYSGLTYPPAFGSVREVNRVLDVTVLISAMRCFFAVAVGIFYICVGIFTRDRKTALTFGILCFLYAGSASHQLVHFVSVSRFKIWYAIEDFCFYMLLAGFAYIAALLSRPKTKHIHLIPLTGAFAGLAVVLSPIFISGGSSLWAAGLSLFVKAYKLAVICFLLHVLTKATAGEEKYSAALLAAVIVFGVSLTVDTVVRLYEPIRYGWPTEIGGFIMVLVLSVIITLDAINSIRERTELFLRNEQLGISYELLIQKIEQTKKSSHDLRHHMAVLSGYAQERNMDEITSYISAYTGGLPANEELHFSKIPAIDAVVRYYYALAKNDGIDISVNISLPESGLPEQDLCVLFGNLLENAIEACRLVKTEKKYIRFTVTSNDSFITVLSDNSYDGIYIEDRGVLHSRKRNEAGTGTASIKAISEKYNGYADFKAGMSEFRASVVLH